MPIGYFNDSRWIGKLPETLDTANDLASLETAISLDAAPS